MKIIVDTNIIFSAILNSTSRIGKILINSKEHFDFYTCDFLRTEISKHQTKIEALTGLSIPEIEELELLVTKKIKFINEKLIPPITVSSTETLLKNIDLGDVPFVALTKHLNGKLWTGDKKLLAGLKVKKFTDTITTIQLSKLLDRLERHS
ncbi:MAG: PIN domain-containing protein [Saprospiraceae bacterium]